MTIISVQNLLKKCHFIKFFERYNIFLPIVHQNRSLNMYIHCTIGYKNFDFFDKMETLRLEMDEKSDSKPQL
jgi:hypothetical protein